MTPRPVPRPSNTEDEPLQLVTVAYRAARPELEALLDDMAWQRRRAGGGSGLMDPSRVRALLGIPERSR